LTKWIIFPENKYKKYPHLEIFQWKLWGVGIFFVVVFLLLLFDFLNKLIFIFGLEIRVLPMNLLGV